MPADRPQPLTWVRPEPVFYHEQSGVEDTSVPADATEAPAAAAPAAAAEVPAPPVEAAVELAPTLDVVAAKAAPVAAETAPAKRSRRSIRRVAGLVVLLAVVAAALAGGSQLWGWFREPHTISTPAKVDGQSLDGSAAPLTGALASQGWKDVSGGTYGTAGVTQMLLIVGRPPAAISAPSTFLPGLAAELIQQGYVVNSRAAASVQSGGIAFGCGPATAAGGEVTLCGWSDGDVAGVVIDFSGESVDQTRALAVAARNAAEH